MQNLSNYSYVCEFEVKTDAKLNSVVIEKLNAITDTNCVESIDPGTFSLDECGYDRQTLRGRYYLKADLIAETESQYIATFKKDLAVVLNAQVEFLRIQPMQLLFLDKLTLIHSLENSKIFYNPDTEKYLVVNSDRYCEGSFDSEVEAANSIE